MAIATEKLKAVELLSQSLNFVFTLAAGLFAAILAFSADRTLTVSSVWLVVGLALLVLTAALAIVTVNSLINKVNDGKDDPIKEREVIVCNVASLVCLLLAVSVGGYVIWNSQPSGGSAGSMSTTVWDGTTVVATRGGDKVMVVKKDTGKVERIEIVPK